MHQQQQFQSDIYIYIYIVRSNNIGNINNTKRSEIIVSASVIAVAEYSSSHLYTYHDDYCTTTSISRRSRSNGNSKSIPYLLYHNLSLDFTRLIKLLHIGYCSRKCRLCVPSVYSINPSPSAIIDSAICVSFDNALVAGDGGAGSGSGSGSDGLVRASIDVVLVSEARLRTTTTTSQQQ